MDEETLKFLPGALITEQFILLKRSVGGTKKFKECVYCTLLDKGAKLCRSCIERKASIEKYNEDPSPWQQVIEVFDQKGTWIGTIQNPDWMPDMQVE